MVWSPDGEGGWSSCQLYYAAGGRSGSRRHPAIFLRPGRRSLPAGRAGLRRRKDPRTTAATITPATAWTPNSARISLYCPLAVAGLLGSLQEAAAAGKA